MPRNSARSVDPMPLGDEALHEALMGAEVMDLGVERQSTQYGANGGGYLQGVVTRSIETAVMHYQENLEPVQVEATDYYYGRPFGDEEHGRSQVVSTDVRDATLDQIPDLMEIFMGSENVVEVRPRTANEVALAEQMTNTANWVFWEDNEGFLVMNSVFKDAGVRKVGFVKWWWESSQRVTGDSMTALTDAEVMLLMEDPELEVEIVGERQEVVPQADPQTGQVTQVPLDLFDVEIRRQPGPGRVRVEEVPPEEVVWTPGSRKFDRAPCVAHVREVPRDELVRMGIPEEVIEEHMGRAPHVGTENLEWARHASIEGGTPHDLFRDDEEYDTSQHPVVFAEAYMLVDTDGDGVGELRMFECVGPSFRVVNGPLNEEGDHIGELVDEIPIAAFTQDPEPHTIVGLCNYDYLREIQRVKSQIQRGQLNSLAQAIEPQMEAVQGQVNMGDLISPEISGVVRVRAPGMLREIKHSFVGPDTLPVLSYYDEIKADRTGVSRAAEGLDPDALQSSTQEAVAATIGKGERRVRMIARVYAETGMKKVMRGIIRLLAKHQNRAMEIELNGQFVEVDPRAWKLDMDVRVNVALGTGSRAEKIQTLMQIAAKQEEHLMAGSPLVSFAEVRNTYGRLTELLGFKNTTEFWRPWGPEQQQAFEQQQAAAAQERKDPAVMVAEVEELKAQLQSIKDRQDLELKELEIRLKDDRERDKLAREFTLKERELELKHQADIKDAELRAQVASDRKAQSTQE